eukprot:1407866-Pyramimonas_sp.AAC.1
MRAILILGQGREQTITPGSEMYRLLRGECARVFDLMKTLPGLLAIKIHECGVAAEDNGSTAFA